MRAGSARAWAVPQKRMRGLRLYVVRTAIFNALARKNANLANDVVETRFIASADTYSFTRCFNACAIIAMSMSLPGFFWQKSYSTAT